LRPKEEKEELHEDKHIAVETFSSVALFNKRLTHIIVHGNLQ
jgi:hypothetical protein